ncbi:MAG: phosphotransacetylase family protein [Halobacteriaceae archaeon]
MNTLLVTAPQESTGKTAVALALATLAADRGRSVGYMKPKGTRLRSVAGKTVDEDPMLARELLGIEAELHELEPVVYSPSFVEEAMRGHQDADELRGRLVESFEGLAEGRDCMVLEGGGTMTTGGAVGLTDTDVADLLDARILLVAGYDEPGDVDDVLAAAEAAGDRLAGVLFNRVGDGAFDRLQSTAVPFLEGRGIPVVGVLPRDEQLAGVPVGELAEELAAEVLTDVPDDGVVERLVVGAMGADASLSHFRRTRNAAVVTGGDRSDIHSVALEAPGVNCLCLTGGFRPSGAVLGKAEQRGVPVLLVQTDTLATVERAEAVVEGGRTRSRATVERMADLLAGHADVEALL